jgi:hypothetical protein
MAREIHVWMRIGSGREEHVGSVRCEPGGDPAGAIPGFLRDLAGVFDRTITAERELREAVSRVLDGPEQEVHGA